MARPKKRRRVRCVPENRRFGPVGLSKCEECDKINMTVEEYETIRLIDLEDFTQAEAAREMDVSRTTVQGIYMDARKKLAEALVEGKMITIEGGHYVVRGSEADRGKGACGRRGKGRI